MAKPVEIPPQSFSRTWQTQVGSRENPVTQIYVREDSVFVYTQDGGVTAMLRATGQVSHTEHVKSGSARLHPPVVLKDYIVYPTTTSLEVYKRSGTFVSSRDLGFSIRSDAVGAKTSVYLGGDYAGGGRIVATDISKPYTLSTWQLMFPGASVVSAPAIVGEIVYAAGEDGGVAAVSTDARESLWPLPNGVFKTGGPIRANLVADESGVYIASADSQLYCLNRNNGKVKWQYFAQVPLDATPVVTKDLVFELVPGAGLVVLDKIAAFDPTKPQYNRHPKWISTDATQFLAEDEKYVYLRRADNKIAALDKASGQPVFATTRNDFTVFAINTKDSSIYASTADGKVLAIKPVLKPGEVGELVLAEPAPQQVAAAR